MPYDAKYELSAISGTLEAQFSFAKLRNGQLRTGFEDPAPGRLCAPVAGLEAGEAGWARRAEVVATGLGELQELLRYLRQDQRWAAVVFAFQVEPRLQYSVLRHDHLFEMIQCNR